MAKYLYLLRETLWPEHPQGEPPAKTQSQLDKTRHAAAKCLRDFFPCKLPFIRLDCLLHGEEIWQYSHIFFAKK